MNTAREAYQSTAKLLTQAWCSGQFLPLGAFLQIRVNNHIVVSQGTAAEKEPVCGIVVSGTQDFSSTEAEGTIEFSDEGTFCPFRCFAQK